MARIQASSGFLYSSNHTAKPCKNTKITSAINMPRLLKDTAAAISFPGLATKILLNNDEHMEFSSGLNSSSPKKHNFDKRIDSAFSRPDPMVIAKLYEIMEATADRVEMHKNVGEQRNNWNSLLLTSINALTLAAATMAAMAAATSVVGNTSGALKISSTTMYLAATGMLAIMNKIQPSQLAEEQRNAARLFKNLHFQIEKLISIGNPTETDVNILMEKVLVLDKAYPLPLLGVMLEKFPAKVEPAVWWRQPHHQHVKGLSGKKDYSNNGWNGKLEEEFREVTGVMRKNDEADYLRLGEKALKLNKVLGRSGPILAGLAALGSAFVGSPSILGSGAAMLGVFGGALATAVNSFEHGAQVGMVFEMYRSNAGFFKFMEESIESNLGEADVDRRENGELLEMKVALQLGRSLSELRNFAAYSASEDGEIEEFASKLF